MEIVKQLSNWQEEALPFLLDLYSTMEDHVTMCELEMETYGEIAGLPIDPAEYLKKVKEDENTLRRLVNEAGIEV